MAVDHVESSATRNRYAQGRKSHWRCRASGDAADAPVWTWNQRLQLGPFFVCQVTWIAFAHPMHMPNVSPLMAVLLSDSNLSIDYASFE
jgi:hypothetical protein